MHAEAAKLNGTYHDPAAGRLTFNQWADRRWEVWAAEPDRSPTTLAPADSRLRLHLRPRFGRHRLGQIRPSLVRQWQHELHGRLAHASVLACRSLFPEATRYVLRYGYLRAVRQATRHGYLVGLDLRGPHDLRHTFATWPEDDGIPTRVIDELMGHAATRRPSWASDRGTAMGTVYRHTTAEMEARVTRALDVRLAVVRSVIDALR